MSQSNCLSEVSFGAFLTYSPKGDSEIAQRSRKWRDHIKRGSKESLKKAVMKLYADQNTLPFRHLFEGDVALVPVPTHAPLVAEDALWVPRLIAELLLSYGLGSSVAPVLKRKYSIAKSAYSLKGQRPTIQIQMDSMEVERELFRAPTRIVVVDDVITKGTTLLSAASLIKEAYPKAHVSCFALLRTMGMVPDVTGIVNPCFGKIFKEGSEGNREP